MRSAMIRFAVRRFMPVVEGQEAASWQDCELVCFNDMDSMVIWNASIIFLLVVLDPCAIVVALAFKL